MAEDSDQEKTEPASSRRIEQAREDGRVPQSRELSAFLVLLAGVATFMMLGGIVYAVGGWSALATIAKAIFLAGEVK